MAASVLAVALLGLIASPGLVYRGARQRRYPSSERRGGVENSLTLLAGATATFVSLWLFASVRGLAPDHTPDLGMLLREPADYIRSQLPYLAVWAAGIYVVALALALFAGIVMPHRRSGIRDVSSWWLIFGDNDRSTPRRWPSRRRSDGTDARATVQQYVGCDLIDGSYLGGYIYAYSTEVEETLDRDVVLVAPISYVPAEPPILDALAAGDSAEKTSHDTPTIADPAELSDIGVAIVSAARIKFMTVTNVQSGTDEDFSHASDSI